MDRNKLTRLVDVAAGREIADLVIKNAKIVDVYSHKIREGDIAIVDGLIAGVGEYVGKEELDAKGQYASPGFIDGHIHIESAYVSPEEIGRLLVPYGGTTIIADPHEIVNVCGITGLDYMLEASKNTALDIKYMLPSCVPATPFENAGAVLDAEKLKEPIKDDRILGLGEFMDYPGVISANPDVLDKIMVAKDNKKLIDGHVPAIEGNDLNAYASVGIKNDHECSTIKEMTDRIERGMYVLLRQGSACHDLEVLADGITEENSRRCLLCSDDRQPKTILELGHLNDHLRICVDKGIDPITAIQMASLNAAECFRLEDRGAISPGLRADIVLFDNLKEFNVNQVFIEGRKVAEKGEYLLPIETHSIDSVRGRFNVKDFSKKKLELKLKSNKVNTIDVLPGGVVTKKGIAEVNIDEEGNFIYDKNQDLVKVAVVERHTGTGNVALGLLRDYGIKEGAIALSIAHDSHNIITVGVSDEDIEFAVKELIKQEGGIVLVKDGEIIESMPMPIAGIMSDRSGEWVSEQLTIIHDAAYRELGISGNVEPVMTLCFMSLAVIPEIKLTDMGLFDVTKFDFIDIEAK